jgi:hypothetical protein
MVKITKTFDKQLEQQIEEGWDDTEVVENMAKFFSRASIHTHFVQNDEGLITHQVLILRCGDMELASHPQEMTWPMMMAPSDDILTQEEIN